MSNGATFKRFDLHLHAPGRGQNFMVGESQGFNSPAERLAFARKYVRQAREEAQLDLIAVTNHNDTSWIEPMRQATRELSQDSHRKGLVVLPGVEVGSFSSPVIHVVVLFEIDTPVEHIERFLDDIGLPDDASRFDKDIVQPCQKSWPDLLTAVQKRNGLAIAAHACEPNGLLHSSVRSIVKPIMFTDERLLGIEIPGRIEVLDETTRHYILNTHREPIWRRQRQIACLNSSDARKLADIGRRFTYVKCEQPSLEALRRALLDHQTRLQLNGEAPEAPRVWLESVVVTPTATGFLSGIRVEFNPLLNCLIGGRGTGKSALIELIRYLWGQSPLKPAELQGFLDVFFPETAEASVEVTVDNGRYRIHRIGRKAVQVSRREGDAWVLTDVRPGDVCPIDIYGQKEILYTSQNVRSQLDLLDRLVGDDMRAIRIERDGLLLELRRNREAMIAAFEQVQDKRSRLERKAAVEEQLKQYYRSGIGDKAQIKRFYDRELQAWENAVRQLQEVQAQVAAAGQKARLDLGYLDDKEIAALPSRAILEELRGHLAGLSETLSRDLAQTAEHLRAAQADVETQRVGWTAKRAAFDDEYAKALAALPGMTPDSVTRLERERLELEQVARDLGARCNELKQLAAQRRLLLTKLGDNMQRQFEARNHKAQAITARLKPRVSVEVLRAGDLDWLSEQFRRVLSGSRLRAEDYNRLAEQASTGLLGILAAIEAADKEMPDGVRIYKPWLPPADITWLEPNPMDHLGQVSGLGDKADKLTANLHFTRRLELDESQVPDRAVVKLNITRQGETQEKWRALGQRLGEGVSVGQGCTAILSIIMLESVHPLIIDQPEDDLDNRFIYDEIVQILRRERGQRQMLIATHNANIPVAGDAEQIIALDAQETAAGQTDVRCKVLASGFVDTSEVNAQVQLILEGGKAAFQLRREKYGF